MKKGFFDAYKENASREYFTVYAKYAEGLVSSEIIDALHKAESGESDSPIITMAKNEAFILENAKISVNPHEMFSGALDAREPSQFIRDERHRKNMIPLRPYTPRIFIDGSNSLAFTAGPDFGHTACDYETAVKAFERGANCLTHTFNAMPPLHHRNPGPIGAAIDKGAFVQVITDGFHIHPSVVKMLDRTFGPDRMIIISDSIAPAGLSDGEYVINGRPIVMKNSHAYLPDGTIAGSASTLMECVRQAISFGIPKEDAIKMASETPANCIGVKKGRIEKGYDADFIVTDGDLNVISTIVCGKKI